MVRCFNEGDLTFDYIVETAKSYGCKLLSTDVKPKSQYGTIKIVNNEPDYGELIFLHKDGIPLKDFKHPEKATYMIGKNSGELAFKPKHATFVSVDTPVDYPLWNFVALAMVLDDRNKKQSISNN